MLQDPGCSGCGSGPPAGSLKELEPDDPMQLAGALAHGDPGLMLDCLVEEYAHMGFDAERILELFQPGYAATHALLLALGPEAVRQRVGEVLARCGVLRVSVRTTHHDRGEA